MPVIDESAFANCSGLTNVVIPEGVTEIKGYAFSGCSGLINLVIPDGVIAIGRSAFEDCSGLTSLTLPAGIKKIGDRSFDGCENLTNISVPAKKTDYYKKRLPEYLHQYIVEREPEKKTKKTKKK